MSVRVQSVGLCSQNRLSEVLAAGLAVSAKTAKGGEKKVNPDGVLNAPDLLDYIALQIVNDTSVEDDGSVMPSSLCERLTSWCSAQKLPCSEAVYKVACTALGIDTEEKSTYLRSMAVLSATSVQAWRQERPWFHTFMTLCRIHGADDGTLTAHWVDTMDAVRRLPPSATREIQAQWMQLKLVAEHGHMDYTGDQEKRARLLSFVAEANLGNDQVDRDRIISEDIDMLLQLQAMMSRSIFDVPLNEADYLEIVEFLKANFLTWDSIGIDMRGGQRKYRTIDFLVSKYCIDLRQPDGSRRLNPVTAHLLTEPNFTGLERTSMEGVPPLLFMATRPHLDHFLPSFVARIRHPLALPVLGFKSPAGKNILHMLLGNTPPAEMLMHWRQKEAALVAIVGVLKATPSGVALFKSMVRAKIPGLLLGLRFHTKQLSLEEVFAVAWEKWQEFQARHSIPVPADLWPIRENIFELLASAESM